MKNQTIAGMILLVLLLGGCGQQQQQPGPPPPTPQQLGRGRDSAPAPSPPAASSPAPETPPPANSSPPAEAPVATMVSEKPDATTSGQSTTTKAKVEPTTEISYRVHAMLQATKRASVQKRLREVATAMHEYHKANQHFPTIDGIGKESGLSWRVYLLPLLGEEELYQKFHLNEAWNSPHNSALIPEMPNVFGSNSEGKTRLHLFTGPNTPFQ
ncbi:MAG TPA: DUF1559 domain-containing protein, partial [Planctomicrobium sp.]|nr:DUF1559 domain-containing protein [Planctomicrobium sp.]